MISIQFENRETLKRALAFLVGRFSGKMLKPNTLIVPDAALEALANENIPFAVQGKATYEQQVAAIRGPSASPIQRRKTRAK